MKALDSIWEIIGLKLYYAENGVRSEAERVEALSSSYHFALLRFSMIAPLWRAKSLVAKVLIPS